MIIEFCFIKNSIATQLKCNNMRDCRVVGDIIEFYGKIRLQLQNMEVKLLKHYQKSLQDKKLLQYKLKELA